MRDGLKFGCVVALCGALVGCGMSEERFLTKLYAAQCEYEFDCAPKLAEEAYGDLDGCDEAYQEQIEEGLLRDVVQVHFDGEICLQARSS